jgi:hypothetical protein
MPTATPLACYTLTLTSADTNYQVSALIAAINAAERKNFSQIVLLGYPGIDGAGANTNDVLVGDAALSTARFFDALPASGSIAIQTGDATSSISTTSLWVRSAASGQKVNVLLRVA